MTTKTKKYSTPEGTWYLAYSKDDEDNTTASFGQAGKKFSTSLENFEVFPTEKHMLARLRFIDSRLLNEDMYKKIEGVLQIDEGHIWLKDTKPQRARDAEGKFIPDDPSTPDYNEAWEGGKAPE